jgi:hypothetical protein
MILLLGSLLWVEWIIILNNEQQEIIKEEGCQEGQGERQVA